jgi:hypothetical protein
MVYNEPLHQAPLLRRSTPHSLTANRIQHRLTQASAQALRTSTCVPALAHMYYTVIRIRGPKALHEHKETDIHEHYEEKDVRPQR